MTHSFGLAFTVLAAAAFWNFVIEPLGTNLLRRRNLSDVRHRVEKTIRGTDVTLGDLSWSRGGYHVVLGSFSHDGDRCRAVSRDGITTNEALDAFVQGYLAGTMEMR